MPKFVDLLAAVIDRDGPDCQHCGGLVFPQDHLLRRKVPHEDGGRREVANLVLVHRCCGQKLEAAYQAARSVPAPAAAVTRQEKTLASIVARDGDTCQHCGVRVAPADAFLRRKVRKQEGGGRTPDNLILVHRRCEEQLECVYWLPEETAPPEPPPAPVTPKSSPRLCDARIRRVLTPEDVVRGACGKKVFSNKKDAKTAANRLAHRGNGELRAYPCDVCAGGVWHLSSRVDPFAPDMSQKRPRRRERELLSVDDDL